MTYLYVGVTAVALSALLWWLEARGEKRTVRRMIEQNKTRGRV